MALRKRHQEEVERHIRKEKQKKQDELDQRRERYEQMKKLEDDARVSAHLIRTYNTHI